MANPPAPPPTRILSWQQEVEVADPEWLTGLKKPWIFEFSNGRLFYQNPLYYTAPN